MSFANITSFRLLSSMKHHTMIEEQRHRRHRHRIWDIIRRNMKNKEDEESGKV